MKTRMMNRADRKKQLITQGAVYRAEVILAKQATEASLRPDSLGRAALHQVAQTAFSILKNRNFNGLPGLNLQTVLPIVMGGISALSKRKSLVKTVARSAVFASVAAGVVALLSRRRKKATATSDAPEAPDAGI
jgi:hypothetical protein